MPVYVTVPDPELTRQDTPPPQPEPAAPALVPDETGTVTIRPDVRDPRGWLPWVAIVLVFGFALFCSAMGWTR